MGNRLAIALLAASSFGIAAPAAAATLIVVGGELTGATGVNVNGSFFDVAFIDGTCASVFNGCASSSDFDFQDEAGAIAAAQSLLDQVLLDTASGNFDSEPGLTAGCEPTTRPNNCQAFVPYGLDVQLTGNGPLPVVLMARAVNTPNTDSVVSSHGGFADTTPDPIFVWAKFTPSADGAVPEPSTWAMMLLGFGFIGRAMRAAKLRQKLAVTYA